MPACRYESPLEHQARSDEQETVSKRWERGGGPCRAGPSLPLPNGARVTSLSRIAHTTSGDRSALEPIRSRHSPSPCGNGATETPRRPLARPLPSQTARTTTMLASITEGAPGRGDRACRNPRRFSGRASSGAAPHQRTPGTAGPAWFGLRRLLDFLRLLRPLRPSGREHFHQRLGDDSHPWVVARDDFGDPMGAQRRGPGLGEP